MPNLNLIAARREEKKKVERITRQLFLGLAASAGLFTMTVVYTGAQQALLGSALKQADDAMANLKPIIADIKKTKEETAELTPKVDTLKSAQLNTMRWRGVLQVVSQSVPSETWLSTLQSSGSNEDATLSLSGMTTSQSRVGQMMDQLQKNRLKLFDNVTLKQTQNSTAPEDPIQKVSFDLSAHLTPMTAPPPPPPAPKREAQAGGDNAPKGGGANG